MKGKGPSVDLAAVQRRIALFNAKGKWKAGINAIIATNRFTSVSDTPGTAAMMFFAVDSCFRCCRCTAALLCRVCSIGMIVLQL